MAEWEGEAVRWRTASVRSFRDWAAECSDAPREVCELALVAVNTNAVAAAYRRTNLFERRRALMEQWAAFLAGSLGIWPCPPNSAETTTTRGPISNGNSPDSFAS